MHASNSKGCYIIPPVPSNSKGCYIIPPVPNPWERRWREEHYAGKAFTARVPAHGGAVQA